MTWVQKFWICWLPGCLTVGGVQTVANITRGVSFSIALVNLDRRVHCSCALMILSDKLENSLKGICE